MRTVIGLKQRQTHLHKENPSLQAAIIDVFPVRPPHKFHLFVSYDFDLIDVSDRSYHYSCEEKLNF